MSGDIRQGVKAQGYVVAVATQPEPVVVLASGAGSLLDALLRASEDPSYGATVAAVVTDRASTGAQHLAEARRRPA